MGMLGDWDDVPGPEPRATPFSSRHGHLRPGQYEEMGLPQGIKKDLPDGIDVRVWVTPSLTVPGQGYHIVGVKARKAGWGNGTAMLLCNCVGGALRLPLVLCGLTKAPCVHARGLRALLRPRPRPAWKKPDED